MLTFTACVPAGTIEPSTPTPVPTPTIHPTMTPVWFPPTTTPTAYPTPLVAPTEDLRPGIGPVIFADDFVNGNLWSLNSTASGSAALGINELTIAISASRTYVYSVRQEPVLSNFYCEITTSPTLCHENDEYGLLLRWNSPQDFYRFSLSCDGRARLDRLIGGTATSPQPWMPTVVPTGAPNTLRLGVWANEAEMRFFINDVYHFTVRDPMIPNGLIGIFARSAGENAVTVNFSDLIIRQIAP